MVDGVGAQDDGRALGYVRSADGGVAHGNAEGHEYGRVDAQDFVADGGKVSEFIDVGCGDGGGGVAGRREGGADFRAQPGLDEWVLAEDINGPGHSGGGGFVAGGEESHELVDEVVVAEAARVDGDRQDIDTRDVAGLGSFGALGVDHTEAGGLDEGRSGADVGVALDGDVADEPEGEEEAEQTEVSSRGVGSEERLVCLEEVVIRIVHSIEGFVQSCLTDDVEGCSASPVAYVDDAGGLFAVWGWCRDSLINGQDQLARLGPKDRI